MTKLVTPQPSPLPAPSLLPQFSCGERALQQASVSCNITTLSCLSAARKSKAYDAAPTSTLSGSRSHSGYDFQSHYGDAPNPNPGYDSQSHSGDSANPGAGSATNNSSCYEAHSNPASSTIAPHEHGLSLTVTAFGTYSSLAAPLSHASIASLVPFHTLEWLDAPSSLTLPKFPLTPYSAQAIVAIVSAHDKAPVKAATLPAALIAVAPGEPALSSSGIQPLVASPLSKLSSELKYAPAESVAKAAGKAAVEAMAETATNAAEEAIMAPAVPAMEVLVAASSESAAETITLLGRAPSAGVAPLSGPVLHLVGFINSYDSSTWGRKKPPLRYRAPATSSSSALTKSLSARVKLRKTEVSACPQAAVSACPPKALAQEACPQTTERACDQAAVRVFPKAALASLPSAAALALTSCTAEPSSYSSTSSHSSSATTALSTPVPSSNAITALSSPLLASVPKASVAPPAHTHRALPMLGNALVTSYPGSTVSAPRLSTSTDAGLDTGMSKTAARESNLDARGSALNTSESAGVGSVNGGSNLKANVSVGCAHSQDNDNCDAAGSVAVMTGAVPRLIEQDWGEAPAVSALPPTLVPMAPTVLSRTLAASSSLSSAVPAVPPAKSPRLAAKSRYRKSFRKLSGIKILALHADALHEASPLEASSHTASLPVAVMALSLLASASAPEPAEPRALVSALAPASALVEPCALTMTPHGPDKALPQHEALPQHLAQMKRSWRQKQNQLIAQTKEYQRKHQLSLAQLCDSFAD